MGHTDSHTQRKGEVKRTGRMPCEGTGLKRGLCKPRDTQMTTRSQQRGAEVSLAALRSSQPYSTFMSYCQPPEL